MTDDQRTLDSSFGDGSDGDDARNASNPSSEQNRGSSREGVLVKLTRKAAKTDPELLEKRTTSSGAFSYPSVDVAEAELVTNEEVKLQSATANQDRFDYYLVRTRPPEAKASERGTPENGWTFQARGNEVGALAQALIAGVGRRPAPIVTYACRDLESERDDLRFWQEDSLEQFQTLGNVGNHSWIPDAVFAVYDETEWQSVESERRDTDRTNNPGNRRAQGEWRREREEQSLRRIYPIEVKHGDASFGRAQRQAMNSLTTLDDERVVPLLVRVTLDTLPHHYDVRVRTGPFGNES
jgi:hypothetical protein